LPQWRTSVRRNVGSINFESRIFQLVSRIRLSPNFIKNNFHWEMADGRWELGRKAGIASAVPCRGGITLYRDFAPAAINSQPSASSNLPYFQDRLPLRVVNH
jgi:hypothetical protein